MTPASWGPPVVVLSPIQFWTPPGTVGGPPEPATVSGGGPLLCGLPADIERMRAADPARALDWRLAVRGVLAEALAGGHRIAGFTRSGYYLLEHPEEAEDK